MNNKINEFPQYRKFANGKHFYKIVDERSFEEIQLVGNKKHRFIFTAKKYPEIIRIQDMIENHELFFVINEEDWNQVANDSNETY